MLVIKKNKIKIKMSNTISTKNYLAVLESFLNEFNGVYFIGNQISAYPDCRER